MGLGLKQIDRRLKSVKSTRQITRAMKLVSAAKLNRAQEAVTKARSYSDALGKMLLELISSPEVTEVAQPLMTAHEKVSKVRILVVGGSRGLCGAYNSNLNKQIDALIKKLKKEKDSNLEIDVVTLGKKPTEYAKRVRLNTAAVYDKLPENPNLWPIEEVCQSIEQAFITNEIDEVYLVGTKFVSVMTQRAYSERLIPFSVENLAANEAPTAGSLTVFEPSAADVFSSLIPRLVRVKVQQSALDAKASEYANRMTAMDSATKNAGDLIDKLGLLYNRLRQQNITGELLDIVGGAEAISQN